MLDLIKFGMGYLGNKYKSMNDPFETMISQQSGSMCISPELWDLQRSSVDLGLKITAFSLFFLMSYNHYFTLSTTITSPFLCLTQNSLHWTFLNQKYENFYSGWLM